jgi:archaellum component FlaF (FlaF/FlaG flagellin family)
LPICLICLLTFAFSLRKSYKQTFNTCDGAQSQTTKRVQDLVNTYVFLVDTQKRNKELVEEVNALSLKVSELEGCKRELLQLKGITEEPPTVEYTLAGSGCLRPFRKG